jgi:hypothetical protein
MALLIPLLPLLLGLLVLGYAWWRKTEFKGAVFAAALYLTLFCGAMPLLAYDGYRWFMAKQWAAAAVSDVLKLLGKAGYDVALLLEPAPLNALQGLNALYLGTNIGWTLLFVPLALLAVWAMIVKPDRVENKEKKK